VSELTGVQFSKPRIQNLNNNDLQAWILDWLGRLGDRELALGIMVLYQLWLSRNNAREETRLADPVEVARRSISLVEEWQAAQTHTSDKQVPINEQWSPPEQGWCKANADGAFLMDQSTGGCGVVLRDHHGGFLSGACRCLQSVSDPERAELLACKLALELAQQVGVSKIILETDCLSAAAKIRNEEKDRSPQGPLVEQTNSF
jgi:hypothetical protein